MKSVGVFEGKTRFSALILDAQQGEATVITRNGVPVAEIGPVQTDKHDRAKQAVERMRGRREHFKAEGKLLSGDEIRELIDEDRE
jgi:antitoxin (DNA-binding transcriptional repressor) of toxin-antitoxin stability system